MTAHVCVISFLRKCSAHATRHYGYRIHCIGKAHPAIRIHQRTTWRAVPTGHPAMTAFINAAEAAQSYLAAIVESSDDAIVSKDLDGIIATWNKSAERIFGYSADEAIGQPITLIIPSERLQEEVEILSRIRRGERTDHFETVRRRKDGKLIDVAVTISPVRDAQGRIIGASKVARDISERKKLETLIREMEMSGRLFQVQDDERRRFARELHDGTGQLLAALSINIDRIAKEKHRLSPRAARCVDENRSLVNQVISEVRTLAHLLHPPLLDEVGLRSVLDEYVRGFAERSNIAVSVDLPEDLGRLPREMELSLFRIVQECLTNIHRHSGSATATVRLSRTPTEIQLEVSDQGRGMSAEVEKKRTGVGFRGMRERVHQLGGTFEVRSSDKGTAILVVLPRSDETELGIPTRTIGQ
jgi:PAS domain S-box-containing protein